MQQLPWISKQADRTILLFVLINIVYLFLGGPFDRYSVHNIYTIVISVGLMVVLLQMRRTGWAIVLSIPLFLGQVVEMGFFLIYGGRLDESAIYSSVNANFSFMHQWASMFLSFKALFVVAVFMVMCSYFIYRLSLETGHKASYKKIHCMALVAFITGGVLLAPKFAFSRIISSIYRYNKYAILYSTEGAKKQFNFTKVNDRQDQVFVLIVGESLSKNRMSLYGYPRETTPLFEKREDIFVFGNVVSPHTHTFASLREIFTFHDSESPDDFWVRHGSLVELFNQAGFTSFWLSNQPAIDMWGTQTVIFSLSSAYRTFAPGNELTFDENLFQEFYRALEVEDEKKFIVIHLHGNHWPYKNATERFHKFTDDTGIPKEDWRTPEMIEKMNRYDNTVLYNDFVVNHIIDTLKEKNLYSSIVYFADHGEEIYDFRDYMGHAEVKGSKYMFEVPFIVWMSDKFKAANKQMIQKVKASIDDPFSVEHFIHFYQDFAGIYTSMYLSEKNPLKYIEEYSD